MRNPPLYFLKLIKELNNTNITKKFEISKYLWKYFVFFCSGGGTRTHDLQVSTEYESRTHFIIKWMTNPKCQFSKLFTVSYSVLSLASYQLLYPTMFSYDGRSRTSISYWTTFMKNNLPLPPFDIISWRKYTTSLSHHSIHLSVMFVNIKQDSKESNQIISLSFLLLRCESLKQTNT